MTYWLAGAAVVSGVVGAWGSNSASKKQQAAAEEAARLRMAAAQQGIDKQMPWYTAGTDALGQLQARLPELTQSYDPQRLLKEPGYQWGLDQGQKAIEQSLAAKGLGVSGAALKAAARFGTDYGTTKLNDAFNRDRTSRMDTFGMLQGLSQGGQRAGESITNALVSAANGAASDKYSGANAGAAGDIAMAGNIQGIVNGVAGAFGGSSQLGGMMKGPSSDYSNEGRNYPYGTSQRYLADGGRVEPVVGTRGPQRRGGTGGAMSNKAVLDALDVAWRDVPSAAPPVPAPADSIAAGALALRNPRAVVEQRLQQAGGYADGGEVCPWHGVALGGGAPRNYARGGAVRGDAPGKSDRIVAHLSPGEHVIDAETVSMLGDGNSDAGHRLLDEMRERLRAFKRSAPANRTAPAIDAA